MTTMTPDPAPRPAEPTFTVVFRGDVRKIGGNLFQIVEPFGEVIAIAVGDALAELDEARALGATKTAVWRGLLLSPALGDRHGLGIVIALDARIAPWRGTPEGLIATLVV